MAELRIYQTSLASVVAITGDNTAHPLGIVQNVQLTKNFETEPVREWGNFQHATILVHGTSATFSWQQAWGAGLDLVGLGLIPSDDQIATFLPFSLLIIDKPSQRNIARIERGIADTYTIDGAARAKLMSNVSGQAISLLYESELN
jgi:hypothetical protein